MPPSGTFFFFILVSLGLFFVLVFPESTSEGGRPHMQSCPGWEREKEEEGNLKTKPIYHASSQSAEGQLPQHLQSRQETVVGRLKERGRRKRKRWRWAEKKDKEEGEGVEDTGSL